VIYNFMDSQIQIGQGKEYFRDVFQLGLYYDIMGQQET
jgi:hypothetical protein